MSMSQYSPEKLPSGRIFSWVAQAPAPLEKVKSTYWRAAKLGASGSLLSEFSDAALSASSGVSAVFSAPSVSVAVSVCSVPSTVPFSTSFFFPQPLKDSTITTINRTTAAVRSLAHLFFIPAPPCKYFQVFIVSALFYQISCQFSH